MQESAKKDDYDLHIKIGLLGDSGVGKTSLIYRFTKNSWDPAIIGTCGIEMNQKICDLPTEQKKIKLEIWDTAGQEKFYSVSTKYYQNLMGVMFVFDLTDRKSFLNIERWINKMQTDMEEGESVCKIIIGTKMDLKPRQIEKKEIDEITTKQMATYIETSSKLGENVNESFIMLARIILRNPNALCKIPENAKKLNSSGYVNQSNHKLMAQDKNNKSSCFCT